MQNTIELQLSNMPKESLALKTLLSRENVPSHQQQKELAHQPEKNLQQKASEHHELALAGGHHNHFKLALGGSAILKNTSQKEIDFYKKNMDATSPFYNIIPKCISFNEKEGSITLENLTANMKDPQVIDIKIGTHSFSGQKKPGIVGFKEALVRRAKWFYRDVKYGFRERGWRVQGCSWIKNQDRGEIGIHSKNYVDDFVKRTNLSKDQLEFISSKFKEIGQVIKNENYGFVNASIMIAVDGKSEPSVKFIDFAHAFEYKNEREKNHSHQNKGPVKGSFALSDIFSQKPECLIKK